jgi:hypothetical protein
MSTAQVTQALIDHPWLAPLVPIIWFVLKSRTARTAAGIIRVAAWDLLLRFKGVTKSKRRALITGAAQRDLESL